MTSGGARPSAAPTFAINELLLGRYRIIRLLGHGEMGEVYKAEDLELHEQVALKTIRATTAPYATAIERLKQEIQLARKVTHPNVSRAFDLEYRSEPGGGVSFLTMELLRGETLS